MWNLISQTDNSIIFELISPDGDQGFPGAIIVTDTFTVTKQDELQIEFSAELIDGKKNLKTAISLSSRLDLNLNGLYNKEGISVLNHILRMTPSKFLEMTPDSI